MAASKSKAKKTEQKFKVNPIVVGLGLAGTAAVLLGAARAPKVVNDARANLSFNFDRMKPKYSVLRPTKLNLELYYTIKNANPVGMPNVDFEGTVMYQNVLLGDLHLDSPVDVLANTTTKDNKVTLTVDLPKLFEEIKDKENVSPQFKEIGDLFGKWKTTNGIGNKALLIANIADKINTLFKLAKANRDVKVVGYVITDLGDIPVDKTVRVV